MKASELSLVLASLAGTIEPGRARDALRYLSSALSQLPPSKTALSALTELGTKLEDASQDTDVSASFSDLANATKPLALLVQNGGSKAAKDSFTALASIIKQHGTKAVRASEDLLAPITPVRVRRPPAPPNLNVVAKHVEALRQARAGTDAFAAALANLSAELEAKKASVADLKAIAEELKVPRPGTTRVKLLSAIAREHETICETLRKIKSGANAG